MNFWVVVVVSVALFTIRLIFASGGETMNVQELKTVWLDSNNKPADETLIDVREPGEFSGGHVPRARNVPLGTLANATETLKSFKTVYVICLSGGRSAKACQTLKSLLASDTRLINIEGGTSAWIGQGFSTEK